MPAHGPRAYAHPGICIPGSIGGWARRREPIGAGGTAIATSGPTSPPATIPTSGPTASDRPDAERGPGARGHELAPPGHEPGGQPRHRRREDDVEPEQSPGPGSPRPRSTPAIVARFHGMKSPTRAAIQ